MAPLFFCLSNFGDCLQIKDWLAFCLFRGNGNFKLLIPRTSNKSVHFRTFVFNRMQAVTGFWILMKAKFNCYDSFQFAINRYKQ